MHRTGRQFHSAIQIVFRIVPALLALLTSAQVLADTEAPRVVLSKQNSDLEVGPGMDASNRSLYGCVFIGQDLANADFSGSDLAGVLIYQCNLTGASFRGASLTKARIGQSGTAKADFTDATINEIYSYHDNDYHHVGLHLSESQMKSTRSYKTRDLTKCVLDMACY